MDKMFEIAFRDLPPSEDRIRVITVSVQVEEIITTCLARLLGVRESKSTRSFGTSSASLSFNAKLNLFLDIKGMTKSDENILVKFSYIRNKFAHVLGVQTIYECLESQSDKSIKKYFERQYANRIEDYEYSALKVREAFNFFLDDVENCCVMIMERMFNKIEAETELLVKTKRREILLKNFLDKSSLSKEEAAFVRKVLLKSQQEM